MNNVKAILRELFSFVLFTTPIGYLLGLLRVIKTNNTNGIVIEPHADKPLNVYVKNSPLPQERLRWIIYGVTLASQGILINNIDSKQSEKIIFYLGFCFFFGVINLVSGIFPNFPWNKRTFKISVFELLILATGIAFFVINLLKKTL